MWEGLRELSGPRVDGVGVSGARVEAGVLCVARGAGGEIVRPLRIASGREAVRVGGRQVGQQIGHFI